MKYWLTILMTLWLFIPINGQEGEPLRIRQFKGLNVDNNPLTKEPGSSDSCLNIDFGKTNKVLSHRDGTEIFTAGIANAVKIGRFTGVYAYNKTNGTKRLFSTFRYDNTEAQYDAAPYQQILRTGPYKDTILSTIMFDYQYWGVRPSWMTYNDILIHSNGKNRPLRYVEDNMRPLVEVPPGSFDLHPVPETTVTATQLLNGEYWYAIRARAPQANLFYYKTDSTNLTGLSYPINVDSDWVYITELPIGGISAPSDSSSDSTVIQICRTRNGSDFIDSFFLVKEIAYLEIDTFQIDSIPDCSLGVSANFPYAGKIDTTQISLAFIPKIVNDTVSDSFYVIGQPQWLGTNKTTAAAPYLWEGIADFLNLEDSIWASTVYAVLTYDSATQMVSGISPKLLVPVSNIDNDTILDSAIRLGLPPLHPNQVTAGQWRLLARARIDSVQSVLTDTLDKDENRAVWIDTTVARQPPNSPPIKPAFYCYLPDGNIDWYHKLRYEIAGEFWCNKKKVDQADLNSRKLKVGTWRIIDTIKNSTDSFYVDDLSWASHNFGSKPALTSFLGWTGLQFNGGVNYLDRVFFFNKNNIYWSDIGDPTKFNDGNSISFETSDGDEITTLKTTGNILNIFKNNSWWRVTEFTIGNFQRNKFLDGIGCIAQESVLELPGGGLTFLHTSGIYLMTNALQSLYKETSGNLTKISEPIQSLLDALSIATLEKCHAWLSEDYKNVVFSFSSTLSYTYTLQTGDWSQWGIGASQSTKYDTTFSEKLRPSREVLWVGDIDLGNIYSPGGLADSISSGSAKSTIKRVWRSTPLFATGANGAITKYAFWQDNSIGASALTVKFLDQDGNTLTTITDATNITYKIFDVDTKPSKYFQIDFTQQTATAGLEIWGIDIWYTPVSLGIEN